MVLRLVSGRMLEKSNRIGPLANRQEVLLTARLRGFPFSQIFNYPGNGKFSKNFSEISVNFRYPENPGFPGFGKFSREIFSSLIILRFFSDFQRFRFNF